MSTDEFDLTFAAGFVTPGRRRNNWIGSNTPTGADGSAYLWEIGSQWIAGSNTYVCTDPTQGSAVWTRLDGGVSLTNPMTTAGDIIYAIASGVPERLGKGTDGQRLQTSNSLVSWADEYTDADAIAAVEGEPTLALSGAITSVGSIVSAGEVTTPLLDSDATLLKVGPTATSIQLRNQLIATADATKEFRPFAAEDGNWDIGSTAAEWKDIHLAGVVYFGDVQVLSGSGTPESVVTAVPGSMYLNTAGGSATTLYIKESGTGDTGWVGK